MNETKSHAYKIIINANVQIKKRVYFNYHYYKDPQFFLDAILLISSQRVPTD